LLCGGLTMLTTAVNFPARRAPSPQIRARDTSLDGTTNGSAGINSAPNVDAGINGATHLGEQRCGDHEDHGDSTDYRKLAEHSCKLPLGAGAGALHQPGFNPSLEDYHAAPSSRWPWGSVALPGSSLRSISSRRRRIRERLL